MAEPKEPFDEYTDQFIMASGPFGVAMTFQRSSSLPGSPGQPSQAVDLGTIRMSLEHLKSMAYILKNQIDDTEENLGITIPVSVVTLNQLKVAPEDWDLFWKKDEC